VENLNIDLEEEKESNCELPIDTANKLRQYNKNYYNKLSKYKVNCDMI
jgi:hypothetical protein